MRPLSRRELLRGAGLGAAAALAGRMPAFAGPFQAADFEKLVPSDKKLSPEWLRSLFERGEPTVYRGKDLEKIGMPVGGICAGQVYLGGDGRLWHWDIFNQPIGTGDGHYAKPPLPASPFEHGFAIWWKGASGEKVRGLDRAGFSDITFRGEYPIGRVTYRDPDCPISVSLEALSPFIPLDPLNSSLPATIMRFTIKNESAAPVECTLAGWLENAVCLHSARAGEGARVNRILRENGLTLLECSSRPPAAIAAPAREPIVFADFEGGGYGDWKVEGKAFGDAPAGGARTIQTLSNFLGRGLVNTWTGSDEPRGRLLSKEFTIDRPFVSFLIGGGQHPGETCINLVVDGRVVRTETGRNADAMAWASWDVKDLAGKSARIEILDNHSGGWGHIDIDQIEFADRPRGGLPLEERPDHGTMCLAIINGLPDDLASAWAGGLFSAEGDLGNGPQAEGDFPEHLQGAVGRKLTLATGQSAVVTFVIAWHFPNIRHLGLSGLEGRKYGKRFPSASTVARYVASNFERLIGQTRLWHDTWYDSTLPHWFLDRTFANTSILATSTAYWLENDRFYAFEGVGCCQGTCTHVWHYAQAMARIFPTIERGTREMVDFGLAFHPQDGSMGFRAEFDMGAAVDGQAGTILRALREHQMSPDDAFLRRNWPRIKKALEFLMGKDPAGRGILEGDQHNTLDAPWFGKIAWLSSLYIAALRAGEQMALEMGDGAFAVETRARAEAGSRNIDGELFNGEYFIQIADQAHERSVGSHDGCEIDQVFGQSWAFQVGLGRILPEDHVKTALRSLWKYNFTPDVGPFRKANQPGRWYAMAGEGGLIMCTWPRGDAHRLKTGYDFYFNECMTGFEYQVAGHMIWEGMVQEGLAIVRSIHDRYHAARRNPWNEVECGDHYARAMASYGVFLAACGYEVHGPRGHLGFAPRPSPEDFRAPFTTAEGWGTFTQKRDGNVQREKIDLKYGKLKIKTMAFQLQGNATSAQAKVAIAGKPLASTSTLKDGRIELSLSEPITLEAGQSLEVDARFGLP